ncbi:MAG: Crp/Fnr family transcriptional regulator [Rhizobacter sp.]|nr:Crp/Fnr family transcriptional regulator [Bacteriovorax sp.]
MKPSFEKFIVNYVSEEWIILLKKYLVEYKFAKGERVFIEGEPVNGIYFINSGKVKIVSNYDKKERLLRLSSNGDLVGQRALSSTNYPVSATVLSDTYLTFIPIDIFKKIVRRNPDFAIYIIDFMAEDLKNTEELLKSMIHNDVVIRIGQIICMLIDAFGFDSKSSKKLAFTLSRSDMASFVGTTYESVIRNLSKLEELNYIELDKKAIIVKKEKDLRAFVSSKV